MTPIKVSASRLKTLEECSLRFYYGEIVGVPQGLSHIKARIGTLVHVIVEVIMNPRRSILFRHILDHGFRFSDCPPSLLRYIRWHCKRELIHEYDLDEIAAMVDVAFLGIKPYFADPLNRPTYHNERRFELKLGDATISGFIDLLLLWSDRCVVLDFKTQKIKFPKAELDSNIQAMLYQTAVSQEFGLIPTVDFIMLRHAPGPRASEKHIQRVQPHSKPILAGLSLYVQEMYKVVNNFTFEEACANPCKNDYFCKSFCPYLLPFDYLSLQKDGHQIKSFTLDNPPKLVHNDERLIKLHHNGCFAKCPQ